MINFSWIIFPFNQNNILCGLCYFYLLLANSVSSHFGSIHKEPIFDVCIPKFFISNAYKFTIAKYLSLLARTTAFFVSLCDQVECLCIYSQPMCDTCDQQVSSIKLLVNISISHINMWRV